MNFNLSNNIKVGQDNIGLDDVLAVLCSPEYYDKLNSKVDSELIKAMITKQNQIKQLENAGYHYWWSDKRKEYLCHIRRNGKRTLIHRKTEMDMISYLMDLLNKSITFGDAYNLWCEYQKNFVSDNTYRRYRTDWTRYFEDTDLAAEGIRIMSDSSIRIFIVDRVKTLILNKKATKTMIGYIKRVFEHLVKESYLEVNPAKEILPKEFYKYSTESRRPEERTVVSDERWALIEGILDETIAKKPYYAGVPLAVKFARHTGMRVGEIAALRWDHVYDDYILIDSSEKSSRLTSDVWIGETKNQSVRVYPITEDMRAILQQCKETSERFQFDKEWVFTNCEGRVRSVLISSCIKNKCLELQRRGYDVPTIGIHCLRRTLNSKIHKQGICTATAASLLGHSYNVNENYYTFDISGLEEKKNIVSNAMRKTAQ